MPLNENLDSRKTNRKRDERFFREELTTPERLSMPLDLVKENVIDINNPPKVPYHFQEFPKLVYHHESSSPSSIEEKVSPDGKSREEIHVPAKLTSRVVNDKEQLRTALEAGFSEQPPTFQEPVAPQESKKGRK